MSVLMTLLIEADGMQLEKVNRDSPEMLTGIVAKAKAHGLITHHFWANSTNVLVVDEWPDEASFHAFFDGTPEIKDLMVAAGANGSPEITSWRKLDLGDDYPD